MVPASQRRVGLDVVRTFAIVLVVGHHLRSMAGVPEWFRGFALRGSVGVDLFFVLSGWLIGGQLFRELRRTGTVALGRFWKRRWLRTILAYLVVLAVLVGLREVPTRALPALLTFTQNYFAPDAWRVTWSLCIEEQFYLALPLLVLAARRVPLSLRIALVVASLAVSPVLRVLAYPAAAAGTYSEWVRSFYGVTHLRLDGLALGVALALLADARPVLWSRIQRRSGWIAIAGFVLVAAATWTPALVGSTSAGVERMRWFPAVAGFGVVSLGVAGLIGWSSDPSTKVPAAGAWAWVAEHAYALYLTHELARDGVAHVFRGRYPGWGVLLVASAVAAVVSAVLLRRFVELPALRWRDRIAG